GNLPADPGPGGAAAVRRAGTPRLAAVVGKGVGGGPKPGVGTGMSEPRVIVVGCGLAGMAAALSCADGGARVTLLAARPRLGGATFSFQREGLSVDNGQHVFLRCCIAYRRFLERVGST